MGFADLKSDDELSAVRSGRKARSRTASAIQPMTTIAPREWVAVTHKGLRANKMKAGIIGAGLLATTTLLAEDRKYDSGADDTEIKIGQTMPYSSPVSWRAQKVGPMNVGV
jgi:hypothetical protein